MLQPVLQENQQPPRHTNRHPPCSDKERGVVWEESIILAPKTARFAFLSATIPNAREFADWVSLLLVRFWLRFSLVLGWFWQPSPVPQVCRLGELD